MNAAQAFAELRALVSGEPGQRRRDDAYACIDAFYDCADAGERAHFEQDYLPYLLGKLDRWPMELLWSPEEAIDRGEMRLARTLKVSRSRGITEAQVLARRQALAEAQHERLAHIQGLWFEFDGVADPVEDVRAVLPLIGPCRHVEIDMKEMRYHAHIHEAIEALVEACGDTIEHLGVSHDLMPTIVPMLESLPSLTSLAVQGILVDAVSHHWFGEIARSPVAQRLESLDVNVLATHFDTSWMHVEGAWGSLKRLRLLGLPEQTAATLLTSSALAHVHTWNLADNSAGRRRDWLDAKTRLWTAKAQGKDCGEVLRHEHVDLLLLPREQVYEIFHDEQGALRPSTSLQSLRMSRLAREVFESLLSRGHEAYPNLTHIHASSADYISPQDYRALDASPLWTQLEHFDWGRLQLGPVYHTRLTPSQREKAYRGWHEVMTDEAMDLELRQRAWATVMQTTEGRKDLEMLARAIGMSGRSKLARARLREHLEALAPSGSA